MRSKPALVKITKNAPQHGDGYHCCNCGSHQKEFDEIQHAQHCEQIRHEQHWIVCRFCEQAAIEYLNSIVKAISNLNFLTAMIWQINEDKGWHEKERHFDGDIALIHSEASEALEEWRNGIEPTEIYFSEQRDKTDKPEGIPVELADIIIRVLHLASLHKIDIENAMKLKLEYNITRSHRHGGKRT